MSLSSVNIVPTQFQNITLAVFLVKMMYGIQNGFSSSSLFSAGGLFSWAPDSRRVCCYVLAPPSICHEPARSDFPALSVLRCFFRAPFNIVQSMIESI
jgi:hypothetical protein